MLEPLLSLPAEKSVEFDVNAICKLKKFITLKCSKGSPGNFNFPLASLVNELRQPTQVLHVTLCIV